MERAELVPLAARRILVEVPDRAAIAAAFCALKAQPMPTRPTVGIGPVRTARGLGCANCSAGSVHRSRAPGLAPVTAGAAGCPGACP